MNKGGKLQLSVTGLEEVRIKVSILKNEAIKRFICV